MRWTNTNEKYNC